MAPRLLGESLRYMDPIGSSRPLLLEEFGVGGWNNGPRYDAAVHYAVAAGAAAAMGHEWGVNKLAPESCYAPLALRACLAAEPDLRVADDCTACSANNLPHR